MSVQKVEIEGTLRADGTLVLGGTVALTPGRVLVIVRPVQVEQSQPPKDDPFWQRM